VTTGSVKAPTPEQLRDVAAELGMSFDDTQLEAHMAALLPGIAAYNIVDRLPDEKPAVVISDTIAALQLSFGWLSSTRPGPPRSYMT
jgi:hypothetical protein